MSTSFDGSSRSNLNFSLNSSQLTAQDVSKSTQDSSLGTTTDDIEPTAVQVQAFPPPQTFTFLPQLYTLFSRLAPLQSLSSSASSSQQQQVAGSTSSTTAPGSANRASRSPTLPRRPPTSSGGAGGDQTQSITDTTTTTATTLTLTQTKSREEAIEIKDLPSLLYPLRQQIERAKDVVKALPDVQRSVQEQEEEIRMLESGIQRLKGRLTELAGLAANADRDENGDGDGSRQDVVMQGVEG